MPKKLKGEPFWIFNIHSVAKHQQFEGVTVWGNFSPKKSHRAEKTKNLKGGPFSISRYCVLREEEKPFCFNSLCQIIQFGTIKFRKTFKNYFGQFVWIEFFYKKPPIAAFHFMQRRLKTVFLLYFKQK